MKTKIIRDSRMNSGAFTGRFYIVNGNTGLAIQSENTKERADSNCQYLNDDSKRVAEKYNTPATIVIYSVVEGEF